MSVHLKKFEEKDNQRKLVSLLECQNPKNYSKDLGYDVVKHWDSDIAKRRENSLFYTVIPINDKKQMVISGPSVMGGNVSAKSGLFTRKSSDRILDKLIGVWSKAAYRRDVSKLKRSNFSSLVIPEEILDLIENFKHNNPRRSRKEHINKSSSKIFLNKFFEFLNCKDPSSYSEDFGYQLVPEEECSNLKNMRIVTFKKFRSGKLFKLHLMGESVFGSEVNFFSKGVPEVTEKIIDEQLKKWSTSAYWKDASRIKNFPFKDIQFPVL